MGVRATKRTVIVLGGFSLLFAAACGGSSDEPTASGTGSAAAPTASAPSASTSSATAATPTALTSHAGTWWHPLATGRNNGPEFQWELDHPLNVRSVRDMGGGALNAARRITPNPTLYDIDGIENPAPTVTALHRLGDKVICYIEVGAAGNYYPAAQEGIPVTYYAELAAAGELGSKVPGYPERYLNINAPRAVSIVESMIRQQCAAKGFDAVEPDIDDSYADRTGFTITEQEAERYDKALSAYAHGLGLAWGQKNGDNDPAFSKALETTTDFLLTEECNFYRTCGIVTSPYVRARKLVLDAEYTGDWGSDTARGLGRFCAADAAGGMDGTLFTSALAGQRNPCR